jgi:arylsulfatase A-like enzyme
MPISRRMFNKTCLSLGAAMASSTVSFGTEKAKTKPNILLILVDDLGKEWISCYGAEDIHTPHIDALAKSGMRFTHAYSMPQCTPSRTTLLTGQYPWRTGWVNHWDVPRWGVGYFDWSKNLAFPRILQQAGYKTCAAGKWQINDFRLEPMAMKKHGFDDWCMWTGYETGNPPSAERYWNPYINTPDGSKTYTGQFGADVFTEYLIRFMRENKDESMFLYFPMALTHTPFTTTPHRQNAESKLEKHKAMAAYTDHCVGRLVSALDELQLRDNTLVIFTTDNGTTGNIHGHIQGRQVRGGKSTKIESGICAPFLVSGPGLVPQGVVSKALTDFTDIAPTCCELAGTAMPSQTPVDGISLADVVSGRRSDSPREWIMAMGHGPAKRDQQGICGMHTFASRVLRDQRYKVWVNEQRQIDQLYDLKEDPFEQNNQIDSEQISIQRVLRKFQSVVDSMPFEDARPRYENRAANAWDMKIHDE